MSRLSRAVVSLVVTALAAGAILPAGAATPTPAPVTPTPASGSPMPAPTPSLAAEQKAMASVFAAIPKARAQLDRAQFDLEVLGVELGGDAADIVAFVRDEIATEQYPGLLRGAQGTLIARAGNALDQAALMQRLLSDAGYEARIVQGRLSADQARTLVAAMFAPRPAPPPLARDLGKLRKAATGGNTAGGEDWDAVFATLAAPAPVTSSQMYSDTLSDAAYFGGLLGKAGVALGDPEAEEALVDEARDYFWVEYRATARNPWAQAHPAFGGAAAPRGVVAGQTYADEAAVPAALRQRIRMEARLERATGGKLEEVPLFPAWEADAASELGNAHSFDILADGFSDEKDFADPRAALKKTLFFYPAMDGELVKDASFFDLQGELVPPTVARSPLAPMLAPGGAMGALSGLFAQDTGATPAPEAKSVLTAVYIDYSCEAPGQSPRIYRRVLMDRIGRDARAAGSTALARPQDPTEDLLDLTARQTFMASNGALAPAFVADRNLAHLERIRPLLELALIGAFRPQTDGELSALYGVGDLPWPDFLNLYQLFDAGVPGDAVAYRPQPGLVVHGQRQDGAKISAWVDVVSNARRAYRMAGGKIAAAPDALLQAGVWDTRTEGTFLPEGVGDGANTLRVMAQAVAQKVPLRALAPGDRAALAKLKIPAGARRLVEAELAAGNAVILPERTPAGAAQYGWLRIGAQDGLSLGIMETGRGQDFGERAIISIVTGMSCIAAARQAQGGPLTGRQIAVCGAAGAAAGLGLAAGATAASASQLFAAALLGGGATGAGVANPPGPVGGK